ncbi:MAG: hypothetical protein Q9181_005647 [Wetmoreana brouardii]
MAFTSQFALTAELTRLLPQIGWAATKTGNAIMDYARDLRHSGSDIVVEEDLVNIFGRCKISDVLTSSFKTIVSGSSSNVSLVEGIFLQGGPGPTVVRALQDSPYFAMVVQISLLVWTFEAKNLATAIADALRKRREGAPSSSTLSSTPDKQTILGVLRACEAQTSAFNWNLMLDAVSTTLGYNSDRGPLDFPQFVLQGLLDMFPMVQRWPSERMIHIQTPIDEKRGSGLCALVVWAHHVLDLTVLVRSCRNNGQSAEYIKFGSADLEQVFLEEVTADDEAFISLLDAETEHLLTIRSDPDAEQGLIGTARRVPARGWGNALLADRMNGLHTYLTTSKAVIQEFQIVTCAFAFIIAKNLSRVNTSRDTVVDMAKMRGMILLDVDQYHLLQASRFLFDNPHISHGQIDSFVAQYSFKALNDNLPRPAALEAALRAVTPLPDNAGVVDIVWMTICDHARRLSVFLIALSYVVNLEDCGELMFAGFAFEKMLKHPLAQQLEEWNGRTSLRITDDAWLQAVAVPLLGHQQNVWKLPWEKICLVSGRGWSAWISTFAASDPGYTRAGSVTVGRGSPYRNGVWKSGILDSTNGYCSFKADMKKAETSGQATALRCAERVSFGTPYCGEGEDVFMVCARFRLHKAGTKQPHLQRFGYKQLQNYLWRAQLLKRCSHGSRMSETIKLAVSCATLAGFGDYLIETEEKILIYLTAHSVGARWLALASVHLVCVWSNDEGEPLGSRQILLRRDDCCFQCAIDEVAAQPGKWFIIL